MKKNQFCKLSSWILGALVAGACLFPAVSQAAEWPARPVELIVPYRAGGDTDFHARTYAKYLEKELGITFTVINMEGAEAVSPCSICPHPVRTAIESCSTRTPTCSLT